MSDFTPTEELVSDAWLQFGWNNGADRSTSEALADFKCWLDSERAKAWNEGHRAGWAHQVGPLSNPYAVDTEKS